MWQPVFELINRRAGNTRKSKDLNRANQRCRFPLLERPLPATIKTDSAIDGIIDFAYFLLYLIFFFLPISSGKVLYPVFTLCDLAHPRCSILHHRYYHLTYPSNHLSFLEYDKPDGF